MPGTRREPIQDIATEYFNSINVTVTPNTTSSNNTRELLNSWYEANSRYVPYNEETGNGGSMPPTVAINSLGERRQLTDTPRFWRNPEAYENRVWLDRDLLASRQPYAKYFDHEDKKCNMHSKLIVELESWANENNVFLVSRTPRSITFRSQHDRNNSFVRRLPTEFYIVANEYNPENLLRDEGYELICGVCSTENNRNNVVCEAEGCINILICPNCGESEVSCRWIEAYGFMCSNCSNICEECGTYSHENFCENCDPHSICNFCNDFVSEEDVIELEINPNIFGEDSDDVNIVSEDLIRDLMQPSEPSQTYILSCCENCSTSVCMCCGSFSRDQLTLQGVFRVCNRCSMRGSNQEENDFEGDGVDVDKIPTIPGREEIRLCGVEIEGANGRDYDSGATLARLLYDAQLSIWDHVLRWDSDGGDSFVHMKHDSSVDWEMVVGPINMAHDLDVTNLNKAVRLVRDQIKNGNAKLDLRAGTHIHVGAEKVGLHQAYNLHILFSYMEDVLYRLGAAKWPIHRAIVNGERHCKKNRKEETKLSFATRYKEDRYYGLSFSNYFNAMLNNCGCGARRYGLWDECTCYLGKCTFEFRIFNATANITKLHAYLAITQALVAKAIKMEEIKNHLDFPTLSFVTKRVSDMGDQEKESLYELWKPRLRYIANELPLTEKEKNSIFYCIANSELSPVASSFLENRSQ